MNGLACELPAAAGVCSGDSAGDAPSLSAAAAGVKLSLPGSCDLAAGVVNALPLLLPAPPPGGAAAMPALEKPWNA
jgi:hypothetical protein